MLVSRSWDTDLHHSEKQTLFRFSIVYILLTIFLISIFSFIYYELQKDLMLQEKKSTLENYSKQLLQDLKHLHINFDKTQVYPRDKYFESAIYDNSEKLSVLVGFTSTGSEFVFWSDNVYGGNLQLVYDIKKIEEGAIGLKGSVALSDGYSGYYGGLNFRIGSRFFGDVDLLFGYSSIKNEKLLTSYNTDQYNGGAFVGTIGIGYRFANPLFVRIAYAGHFPFSSKGLNSTFIFQLGYRIK